MRLHTENLVKKYSGRAVVNDVSVEVNHGEIVGLLGPNGAGKTTSFYMMVGLIKPNSGGIYLEGVDITREPMYKRAQLGIGYLPQEPSIFRKMTVENNIRSVLEISGLPKNQQKDRLEILLDEFGLNHVRTSRGDLLSGGERRRTEIARSLAINPKFILLDEPFAGVDPISVREIQGIIKQLTDQSIGVLITDHNVREMLGICHHAYILNEGQVLAEGDAETIMANEEVRNVYLGNEFRL